jgi:hypothetical protein
MVCDDYTPRYERRRQNSIVSAYPPGQLSFAGIVEQAELTPSRMV